ncbi:BF3164 family lipoprotein [Marivirga arenosa]|uniref:BF3164 family lipoprotein n=1 Tax=Marivirga arenosa TaxID=3059076 RepID=A0AA51N711_9BACT|nr:BF3164 family lipoprotein [Marivirga sp. ABR2-2]WMN07263.1 BF3164 family lipoprotein [Marivirga sp. ABR2-2]
MHSIKTYVIAVFLVSALFSCSNSEKIKHFSLTHEVIDLDPHYYGKDYQFDISNDTLIILDGYSDDKLFNVYNLKNNKLIGKFGIVGEAPYQVSRSGFFFWDKSQGKIFIADYASLNLKEFKINAALINKKYQPNVIHHPRDLTVAFFQSINDSTFITRQLDQTDDLLVTFNQEKVLDTIGKWYSNRDPILLFDKFQQYYYVNNKHPHQNKFVASYFSYDIIQIVDGETRESTIVQGPDKISYKDNKDEFLAYRWAETTGNYIYASYIGEFASNDPNTSQYAEEIHVISWEGEHIARLDLDVPIRFSHVDEEKGFIYALADDKNGNFVKFKLPEL